MFFKNRYDHTNCVFCDSRILKFADILYLQTSLFVHKSAHLFSLYRDCTIMTYHVTTGRQQKLRIPLSRTSHAQQSILVRGRRSWNIKQHDIITECNEYSFQRKLLKMLFNI